MPVPCHHGNERVRYLLRLCRILSGKRGMQSRGIVIGRVCHHERLTSDSVNFLSSCGVILCTSAFFAILNAISRISRPERSMIFRLSSSAWRAREEARSSALALASSRISFSSASAFFWASAIFSLALLRASVSMPSFYFFLPPREDIKERLEYEPMQNGKQYQKIDRLKKKQPPIDAEIVYKILHARCQ